MRADRSPGSPIVGVIAVNWNDARRSLVCMRSVLGTRAAATLLPILVDNGSDLDPTTTFAKALPSVEVVRLRQNGGYAAGCNAGARRALDGGANYLFFLNNDATIEAQTVSALLAAAEAFPGTILGPKIVYSQDPARIWSAGGWLSRPGMQNRHIGQGEPVQSQTTPRQVDWTTGCAMFVAASTYRRLGPMDEDYFLYLEDVDWCLRGARLGIATRFVPAAVVRHEVSTSAGSLPPDHILYYACRNTYRLAFRNNPIGRKPRLLADLLITGAKVAVRNAFFSAYRRDPYYQARTAAVLDATLGRWGPPRRLLPPSTVHRPLAGPPDARHIERIR